MNHLNLFISLVEFYIIISIPIQLVSLVIKFKHYKHEKDWYNEIRNQE